MGNMMITAHSGCDGTEMNSLEYILHALSLPIDALEFDVRMGLDERLWLTHDPIGEKPLLSLEEGFSLAAQNSMKINCDLKEYGMESALLSCAKACGIGQERLIFTGSVTNCLHFKKSWPDVTVWINAEELIDGFYELLANQASPESRMDLIRNLSRLCRQAGYTCLNMNYLVCDESFFDICRKEGVGLSVWTVDNIDQMRRMEALGALNLTTNLTREAAR